MNNSALQLKQAEKKPSRKPRLAMMACVNNEAETIADYLHYHRHIGVTKAYIFLDHCTDSTKAILEEFPWVVATERSHSEKCASVTVHQNACSVEALEMAREDGYDWLMHIDPDEYVMADNPEADLDKKANLLIMLQQVMPETEMIKLQAREVIAIKGESNRPLWSQCYFQERPHVLNRAIMNPITGEMEELEKWIGHNMGKSIVRVDANVSPISAHGWKRAGESEPEDLVSEDMGYVYHYVLSGADLWHKKYRKLSWEPDVWPLVGSKVLFPKQAWKEASLLFSEEEAKSYYEEWVAIDKEIVKQLVQSGKAVRQSYIFATMKMLNNIKRNKQKKSTEKKEASIAIRLRDGFSNLAARLWKSKTNQSQENDNNGYKKFIIIGRVRTGTSYLQTLLDSHPQIISNGETFHLIHRRNNGLKELLEDPISYVSTQIYKPHSGEIKAVGYKMVYGHMGSDNTFLKKVNTANMPDEKQVTRKEFYAYLTSTFDVDKARQNLANFLDNLANDLSVNVIHIKRRNLLDACLSEKLARTSGVWNSAIGTYPSEPIQLDFDECLRHFVRTKEKEDRYDLLFQKHESIDIVYEDMISDNGKTLKLVQEFLGVKHANLTSMYIKQNQRSQCELISNYAELKEQFRNTEWYRHFK